jgi:hypothetical protein
MTCRIYFRKGWRTQSWIELKIDADAEVSSICGHEIYARTTGQCIGRTAYIYDMRRMT